jgi:hypothetical protein
VSNGPTEAVNKLRVAPGDRAVVARVKRVVFEFRRVDH